MADEVFQKQIAENKQESDNMDSYFAEVLLHGEPNILFQFHHTPSEEKLNKAFDILFNAVIDTYGHFG